MTEIGKEVNKISRKIIHTVDGMNNNYGLSPASLRVLGYIANHEVVYQSDFEAFLHIRRSSISSILSNLEAKGYIQRSTDPSDTRRKRVLLTEAGIKVEKETFMQTIGRLEEELSDCLTKQEQQALLTCLDKLSARLDTILKEGLDV